MVRRSNKRKRGRQAKGKQLDVDSKPKVLKPKRVSKRSRERFAVALS